MLNEVLLTFAQWLGAQQWSTGLHESFYMYNWIETTHVLTLTVFLGMLFVIDLRMLGVALTDVPASKIAERLDLPMMIGFTVMIITGLLLFYAIPVRTTQSVWFRLKVILLIAAGINAWIFRNRMKAAKPTWDLDPVPPKNVRIGAGLSLTLWIAIIFAGRAIAYDWFDCGKDQSAFLNWAAGCVADVAAH
ncbi:putative membrane protein [Povalibacter uvarum]|uniref:Putative membrane protein n=1 Tax=Povalibacter uvarum TaxID=732238 RepID=A0A841HPT2_9GAMM|nr:DUF6644 family protein [Povalibacter uvarum]MBB6095341.1 putative membrane protein [Povalibacter uvarum]